MGTTPSYACATGCNKENDSCDLVCDSRGCCANHAPIVIAIDIDDTLVHLVDTFQQWCKLRDNNGELPEDWCVDPFREQYYAELSAPVSLRRTTFMNSPMFRNLPPISGASDALQVLRAAGFRLEVVTARNSMLRATTEEMMNNLFPGIFSGMHYSDNTLKGSLCKSTGAKVLVDDSICQLADAVKHGLIGILFDYEGRYTWTQGKELPPGVTRLKSWGEVAQWISNWDSASRVPQDDCVNLPGECVVRPLVQQEPFHAQGFQSGKILRDQTGKSRFKYVDAEKGRAVSTTCAASPTTTASLSENGRCVSSETSSQK